MAQTISPAFSVPCSEHFHILNSEFEIRTVHLSFKGLHFCETYLNWSSSNRGLWAAKYLLIVSSSLGTGSLKHVKNSNTINQYESFGSQQSSKCYIARRYQSCLGPLAVVDLKSMVHFHLHSSQS